MIDEFTLIGRLAALLPGSQAEGVIGIGDDCAALPDGDAHWLLTCDAAAQGRHFQLGRTPLADIGWRVATANVSDVCACGGSPVAALVSLGLPEDFPPADLEEIYTGLAEAGRAYGFTVLGGNVSGAAELFIDVFMLGRGQRFVARGGARPGDLLAVSGPLGEAAAGLSLLYDSISPPAGGHAGLVAAHLRPRARTDLVPLVQAHASACIDISDGLSSELWHLAGASGQRLDVRGEALPLSAAFLAFCRAAGWEPLKSALNSGEEYQLLAAFPPEGRALLEAGGFTVIGEVSPGEGVFLDGAPLAAHGWNHLRREP